jgi:hypothetical protein
MPFKRSRPPNVNAENHCSASIVNDDYPGSLGIVEDLLCTICLRLVLEAAQTGCCGNLYCRKCIFTWLNTNATCPSCRAGLRFDDVLPDVRAERRSAAATRRCVHYQYGCRFEGNRAAMHYHEIMCAFAPQEIREKQISKLLRTSENYRDAALGPRPSIQALKTMYDMAENAEVLHIKRSRRQLVEVCTLKVEGAAFALEVDETNYNLGVYLRKSSAVEVRHDIQVSLLHPKETFLAAEFIFSQEKLNRTTVGKAMGFCAMRSLSFDSYCAHGYFFLAVVGASRLL